MNIVYYAHSGLRYLVLLSALVALVVLARGLSGRRPFDGAARTSTAIYTGAVHLQVALGILMVILGRWYPALMGHLTMMILAVAAVSVLGGWAKRAADAKQAYKYAFAGVAVSLLLILAGIAAIGRHPLQSRALDQIRAESR